MLGRVTTLSLANLYLENCLGNKVFNTCRLPELLEHPEKKGEPLIYAPRLNEEEYCGYLIFYAIPEENERDQFLKVKIKSELDIKYFNKHTDINVHVSPLFLYQSSEFHQILSRSLTIIFNLAKSKYQPSSSYKKAGKGEEQSDH